MSAFYIAAAHKSSGKTTLSIGLTAALRQAGKTIQTFKKGPDYIDPLWLSRASGRPCQNLDFFTASTNHIQQQFVTHSAGSDAILVEGNMGLFDGISVDGSDSNAAMAKLLDLPVVLIVDCSGTSRGIAPLLLGYRQFDPMLRFAGVILNKVAGRRHESKLVEMVETYTDFDILGAVHRNDDLRLTERHLGLIPSNELDDQADQLIERFADVIRQSIDLEKILNIPALALPRQAAHATEPEKQTNRLKIGIAMDEAFGFYYPSDLQRFSELGVEIVPFSAIHDSALPGDLDGLFIGGGFPESLATQLSANASMRTSIAGAIRAGLPTYAECGGLMYLCQELENGDGIFPQCGVIPAQVRMNKRPQGRGYVVLQASPLHPWQAARSIEPPLIQAHEFHYSSLHGLPDDTRFAYSVQRGTGIDGSNDGIMLYNLLASYAHLRSTDRCSWVDDFVSFIESQKSSAPS
jgi:cobyrinic acid a,c-diamide synthase